MQSAWHCARFRCFTVHSTLQTLYLPFVLTNLYNAMILCLPCLIICFYSHNNERTLMITITLQCLIQCHCPLVVGAQCHRRCGLRNDITMSCSYSRATTIDPCRRGIVHQPMHNTTAHDYVILFIYQVGWHSCAFHSGMLRMRWGRKPLHPYGWLLDCCTHKTKPSGRPTRAKLSDVRYYIKIEPSRAVRKFRFLLCVANIHNSLVSRSLIIYYYA